MSRTTELLNELNRALIARAAARDAVRESREALSETRRRLKEAEALVEEIQGEIQTGKSGRPIMDAISARAEAEEETADERQRGITALRRSGEPMPGPKRKKAEAARWQDVSLPEILPDDCDGCKPADVEHEAERLKAASEADRKPVRRRKASKAAPAAEVAP